MRKIEVRTENKSYDILISKDSGIFTDETMNKMLGGRSTFLVIDSAVDSIYGEEITSFIRGKSDFKGKYIVPSGEVNKNFRVLEDILRTMLRCECDRKSLLIAAGGGVTGDMGGFAASIFMRGIEYINIPTTLLAMVDSSVGGKTAVDIPEGKNIAGTFWQPSMVAIDISKLKSLPVREIGAGLSEVLKYAIIRDREFFNFLGAHYEKISNLDIDIYEEFISRCCSIKAEIVGRDEKESSGERALLNLGHTFGHALETVSGYNSFLHGEAVAIGIMMASELACRIGRFDKSKTLLIGELMSKLGLKTRAGMKLKAEDLYKAMFSDKKSLGGKINFVIPAGDIGKAEIVSEIPEQYVIESIKSRL